MSRLNFVLAAFLLVEAVPARAAELKQETLDAWSRYVHEANVHMQDRAKGQFLWIDESSERAGRVHAGEVVVSPVSRAPRAVPSGLIHHWIGAAFIPGAGIDDVVAMVRNYDRYADYYKPSVIDAKTLSREADEDRYSVVIADKAMFMKRAIDSDYSARFVQVSGRKWYSIAQTTRLQELADREPVPESQASGYIWRFCTMSRYEERDGGVYIETEAMALSRPIPGTLHWIVDPIVRRVSRATLTMSLEQTREAAGSASARMTLDSAKRSCLVAFNCP